ncbi:MAG: hypothetical protein IJE97_03280 [Thermoguttaceae bacterium]|nr:hypothetical protein [Thermoguttaceae bacterium]
MQIGCLTQEAQVGRRSTRRPAPQPPSSLQSRRRFGRFSENREAGSDGVAARRGFTG